MERPSLDNKVYTENPLLDEIIYNIRQLCTGTVLKDQDKADECESLESIQNGDVLLAIGNGLVQFSYFDYDVRILTQVPGLSEELIQEYALDNSLIPEDIQPLLLEMAISQFQDNYIEKNNYYRMLHGLPNISNDTIFEGMWVDIRTIEEGRLATISTVYSDEPGRDFKLIHELEISYIETLYDNGTIENILNTDWTSYNITKQELLYLNHLGGRSIDFFDARKAGRFEMLYCPTADSTEVQTRYMDLLESNRLYMLYTTYSEAMKFQSDYYDNFMMIFLIIQTMIDMIIELPEYIIRRDVFDDRTCQYIFESNGVEYFPDIPLRYQISLVKNLNKLIKFKSSDKCIVDICSIFGIDNIQVFKYYILKSRNINNIVDMEYIYNEKDKVDSEGNITKEEDLDKDYDLNFIKVPLGEKYDDYIRVENNIKKYDSMVESDDYWDGDKEHDVVESDIKGMDFTVLRSKYYSVEAVIDITKRNFTLTYFLNLIMWNKIDSSKLTVSLPNISTKKKFELVDAIITLYTLSYIYYGAEDTIQYEGQKIAKILGFNLEADLGKIDDHLFEHHERMSMEMLGVDRFQLPPNNQILSYNQLEDLYFNNKAIYDHVRSVLIDPPSKEIYDCYKYIYKSLFIMDFHLDYFILPNGEMAETYREFLRYKDPILYNFLENIVIIKSVDARQKSCVNAIQSITTYLKDYIDQDLIDLDDVFSGLPSIAMDFIKRYVEEVVNFFKSFKIFTHDASILYLFNDKFENTVKLIDWCDLWYTLDKGDIVKIEDWIKNNHTELTQKERLELLDKVYFAIYRFVEKHYNDYYDNEKYKDLTNIIREVIERFASYEFNDYSLQETFLLDKLGEILVHLTLATDYSIITSSAQWNISFLLEDFYENWIFDLMYRYISKLNKNDNYVLIDYLRRYTNIFDYEWMNIRDGNYNSKVSISIDDKDTNSMGLSIQDNCYMIITNSTN